MRLLIPQTDMNKADWIGIFLVISALGVGTYIRNAEWKSPVTLWEKNVVAYPYKARPHMALASSYLERNAPGDESRAVTQVWMACQIRPALLELFKDTEDVNWDIVRSMKDWNR